jgi:hypothetical protein
MEVQIPALHLGVAEPVASWPPLSVPSMVARWWEPMFLLGLLVLLEFD